LEKSTRQISQRITSSLYSYIQITQNCRYEMKLLMRQPIFPQTDLFGWNMVIASSTPTWCTNVCPCFQSS
jgi:hypothetical protein